jgi:membrane-bound ClpP family serine protease
MCHIVLILPVLGLVVFVMLPFDIALPVYAVILSIYFYITIMRAMKKPVETGSEEMMHETVSVLDTIKPEGHVKFQNEIWNASSGEILKKGDRAEIIGLNGLTLIVKKILTN